LRFLDIGLSRDGAQRGRPEVHASGAARVAAHRKRKSVLKQEMENLQAESPTRNSSGADFGSAEPPRQ
jgi:hypothetical protein